MIFAHLSPIPNIHTKDQLVYDNHLNSKTLSKSISMFYFYFLILPFKYKEPLAIRHHILVEKLRL